MRYLPILQELFESDTFIFFAIGLIVFIVIGLRIKHTKKIAIHIGISLCVYIICELLSNLRTNYMLEVMLLFISTLTLGAMVGYLIDFILLIRSKKRT